jgi:hypothetical protein
MCISHGNGRGDLNAIGAVPSSGDPRNCEAFRNPNAGHALLSLAGADRVAMPGQVGSTQAQLLHAVADLPFATDAQ